MKIQINRETLRQHWHYSKLKYFVMIIAIAVAWNLVYTTTAYRPPTEKKCDFFVSSASGDQTLLNTYLEGVRQKDLPQMEQMVSAFLTTDDYYAAAQIVTYIAAGEGTVYMLPAAQFQNYAAGEYFIQLEGYTELLENLESVGVNVEKGWRTVTETGERHLYGIPASTLTGLSQFYVKADDMYLCVPSSHGNDDVAVQFIQILFRDMMPGAENISITPIDFGEATASPAA